MFKFLRRFYSNQINKRKNSSSNQLVEVDSPEKDDSLRSRYPLTITIHAASGGLIISVRSHNTKLDEWQYKNYIVHEEDEISKAIENIIFIERLSQ